MSYAGIIELYDQYQYLVVLGYRASEDHRNTGFVILHSPTSRSVVPILESSVIKPVTIATGTIYLTGAVS